MANIFKSHETSLENIDIISEIAHVAANRLASFYSSNNTINDYEALFDSYFNDAFGLDIENHFNRLLRSASKIDANFFFIKTSQFVISDKKFKSNIYANTWSQIQSALWAHLFDLVKVEEEDEFYSFLSNYLFSFLDHQVKVSDLFITLKEKFENSLDAVQSFLSSKKLKTNLSVPELILLFRSLSELKPSIFEVKSNEELFEFIAQCFETKKSSNLSKASIKNKFYEFDEKAKNFWQGNFSTMQNFVTKLEQK